MNYKFFFILLIITIFSITLLSQNYYPLSFWVIDKNTSYPIESATIIIKELGFEGRNTDQEGKAYYKNVPNGEINYTVYQNGYEVYKSTINITSETKSNTTIVELTPSNSNTLLIMGEITDSKGLKVEKANVKMRIGKNVLNSFTDELGLFAIEIEQSLLNNNISELILSINTKNCKHNERLILPKQSYVFRSITLSCSAIEKRTTNDQPKTIRKNNIPLPFNGVSLNFNWGESFFLASINYERNIAQDFFIFVGFSYSQHERLNIEVSNEKYDKFYNNFGPTIGGKYYFLKTRNKPFIGVGINAVRTRIATEIVNGIDPFQRTIERQYSYEFFSELGWRLALGNSLFFEANMKYMFYESYSLSSHLLGGFSIGVTFN